MTTCPFANLLDMDVYANGIPYEELEKLRKAGSIHLLDDPIEGIPYWVAVKRDALDYISQNPDLFSSELHGPWPMEVSREANFEAIRDSFIICMDPPKHMKYRKVVRDAFSPRGVAELAPWLEKTAREIVDQVATRGECEAITEIAAELPLMTIMEVLGVPQEDRHLHFEWTNQMAFADDPDIATGQEVSDDASANMMAYAYEHGARQRKNPTSGVVKALLEGAVDGVPITDEMFAWMYLLIVVGGNESTRSVTAQGIKLLIEHPDQLQHLVEHPEDIPDAVEEILRYNTAFIMMRRTATENVQVCGKNIGKGEKVILHYHAVNHDEDVFGLDSMSFDIHRAKRIANMSREIRSFGIGEHFCLGMNLARAELRAIFAEIIPRLRNMKLAGEVTYMRSYFTSTIKSMPISFDVENQTG